MNIEQTKTYLQALAGQVTVGVIVPLLMLTVMAILIWVLIARAQQDTTFNIQNVLRNDEQKESMERLLTVCSFAITAWVLAVVTFAMPDKLVDVYLIFILFWSGTPIARDVIAKWDGTLPFSKPKAAS